MMKILILLLAIFAHEALAKNGTREVLLENDKVQVVRLIYPAGGESGMHSHQYDNRVAYMIKGGTLGIVTKDGKMKTVRAGDGATLYLSKETHNIKNLGKEELVILETEIK